MSIRSIKDVDVAGKRVLVRADLNVPVQDGKVTDSTRIDRFAEGMKPLSANGERLVIFTHMVRPMGELNPAMFDD